jgi:hypothetical protein
MLHYYVFIYCKIKWNLHFISGGRTVLIAVKFKGSWMKYINWEMIKDEVQ